MDTIMLELGAYLTAAAMIESFVEYTFANMIGGKWLMYIALTIGIITSFGFNLDITHILGLTAVAPWIGKIATGLIIGRGSNFINDLITRTRGGSSSPVETGKIS